MTQGNPPPILNKITLFSLVFSDTTTETSIIAVVKLPDGLSQPFNQLSLIIALTPARRFPAKKQKLPHPHRPAVKLTSVPSCMTSYIAQYSCTAVQLVVIVNYDVLVCTKLLGVL